MIAPAASFAASLASERITDKKTLQKSEAETLNKLVAEIKSPQNIIRVWLGTPDMAEAVYVYYYTAYAYNCTAYKFHGVLHRLEFS